MCSEQLSQENESVFEKGPMTVEAFSLALSKRGLTVERERTTTLQVNVGLLCNQKCKHCHFSAGPDRRESMRSETVNEVIAYAQRSHFDTIDITGGAPELNPNLVTLIEKLSPLAPRIMLRSNLTALNVATRKHLMDILKEYRVVVVASFPSFNESQADSQRGGGVFQESISTLKKLNAMGYGQDGSGFELDLVSNPTGAFMPSSQAQTETRFHQVLEQKWGISFNDLFNFANVPLGRFFQWLLQSGNFETYMQRLASNFNPGAVEGLMCRTLVSISWDGYLYDCDFNLARGLFMGGQKIHISEMSGPPELGSPIAVADHCYTCTAGAGFT